MPAQGYGLGIASPRRPHVEARCPRPPRGISACRFLPWPHFPTRDHREDDQTGRYRDRLETQQEMGAGVSEKEAADY